MQQFDRHSEKYTPLGNMSAQGIKRLLGTPTIDQLQTVIREAVQNSWDASTGERTPVFSVHLRKLASQEMVTIREIIFSDYIPEDQQDCLSNFLNQENPWVLELSDIGTSGLGGPTDASVITQDHENSDFVDFVRNVGSPRDTKHGGGTYGYGKSSLYSLSRCGTILIDSLTTYMNRDERRVIGCRTASSFIVEKGDHKGKYTGRHWWGKKTPENGGLDPVKGLPAEEISKQLGLFQRGQGDYGTTIMIIDPLLEASPHEVMNAIQRSLLWNFWPKLVNYPGRGVTMKFRTILDGEELSLPDVEDCPPLDIFSAAMLELKSEGGISIVCKQPKKNLGKLKIVKTAKGTRLPGFGPTDDGMFPEASCHVALMRPAELVVKYLEGNLLPPSAEWGGLFICSDENEVEEAFAMAEPPAHDDWIPSSLPRGHQKTYVNVALRNIKIEMEQAVSAIPVKSENGNAELAKLSSRMGSLLSGALGDGISLERPATRKRKGGGKKKSLRIVGLEGIGPAEWVNGEILAWFSFSIESSEPKNIKVTGTSKIYIDGELSNDSPDGSRPEIRIWTDKNDQVLSNSSTLEIDSGKAVNIRVGISIPKESAISFTPEIIE